MMNLPLAESQVYCDVVYYYYFWFIFQHHNSWSERRKCDHISHSVRGWNAEANFTHEHQKMFLLKVQRIWSRFSQQLLFTHAPHSRGVCSGEAANVREGIVCRYDVGMHNMMCSVESAALGSRHLRTLINVCFQRQKGDNVFTSLCFFIVLAKNCMKFWTDFNQSHRK